MIPKLHILEYTREEFIEEVMSEYCPSSLGLIETAVDCGNGCDKCIECALDNVVFKGEE